MPFSATYNDPDATLVVRNRLLITPFAIGLILFSCLVEGTGGKRTFWFVVAILAALTGWVGGNLKNTLVTPVVAVPSAAVVLLFGPKIYAIYMESQSKLLGLAGLLFVTLIALSIWTPYKQRLTDAKLRNSSIGAVVRAVESLPGDARVVAFGPGSGKYYPLFGRKYQLIPRSVDSNGLIMPPTHERWADGPFAWWPDPITDVPDNLTTNLRASGIDYAVVIGEDGQWPPYQSVLEAANDSRLVHEESNIAVWKIVDSEYMR